jgi:hypothetical protein
MNKKTIYIIVAVLVVVIVAAAAGVLLMNRNSGNNPQATATPTATATDVAHATSLQFNVTSDTGHYRFSAANITTGAVLSIEYFDTTAGFKIIVNSSAHTASSNMTGTWTTDDYQTTWDQWNPLFQGYITNLANWTSGAWTSTDGKTTLSDISVNTALDASLFKVPS